MRSNQATLHVNLASTRMSAVPHILTRRRALHAVPHFQQVVCIYSSLHRPLLTFMTPVLADLSTIPSKYHVFISPPLRRVYLGGMDDSGQVVMDGLKSEITTLKERITALNRDKISLSKDLLESRSTVSRLASAERAARLSLDEVKEVACLANQRLEGLKAEYDSLKSR